jgi:drug/metabolite transporter (DMT)-like permease
MSHSHVTAAVTVGLLSACCFAASNALQHRVAGTVPPEVDKALGVLGHLARKPMWLFGTTVSFCALLLHASALRIGSIALVQPLMLVGVVLAVPVRSALELKMPTARELHAVLLTAVGLGTFLACANPRASASRPSLVLASVMVLCGAFSAAVVLRNVNRLAGRPRAQAAALGATAGLMFGLTAGLLKLVSSAASEEPPEVLAVALSALAGLGLLGTAMNQRAYQLAPLSHSLPLVNVLDILVAVIFGALVFHELPGQSPHLLVLQGLALCCLALGLRRIARLQSGDQLPTSAAARR